MNVLRTNIKFQRHLESVGRRRRRTLATWNDELDRQLKALSISNRIGQDSANTLRGKIQKDIIWSIQLLETRSVKFYNADHLPRTSRYRAPKRIPGEVRQRYQGMWLSCICPYNYRVITAFYRILPDFSFWAGNCHYRSSEHQNYHPGNWAVTLPQVTVANSLVNIMSFNNAFMRHSVSLKDALCNSDRSVHR